MKKRCGFTLIELLVVIAIIALLLSVIVPSLGKAKRKARKVICLSNTRQIGLGWFAYTNDSKGLLPTGWIGNFAQSTFWNHTDDVSGKGTCLYPYFNDDRKVFMCPEVRGTIYQVIDSELNPTNIQTPLWAWGEWAVPGELGSPDVFKGDYGSYGINYWSGNHPTDTNKYWKRADISGGNQIPLFAESFWPSSGANHADQPPAYEGEFGGGTGDMRRFVVNRHEGRTSVLFMDFSARSVSLKGLWKLKWHRQFNVNNPPGMPNYQWPRWMENFPSE